MSHRIKIVRLAPPGALYSIPTDTDTVPNETIFIWGNSSQKITYHVLHIYP